MPPPLHPTTTTPLAEIAHYEAVLISNPFTPQNTSGSSIQTDLLEFLRMKKRDSKIIANATISHTALKKSPSSESWEVVNNSPSPSPPPAPPNKPKNASIPGFADASSQKPTPKPFTDSSDPFSSSSSPNNNSNYLDTVEKMVNPHGQRSSTNFIRPDFPLEDFRNVPGAGLGGVEAGRNGGGDLVGPNHPMFAPNADSETYTDLGGLGMQPRYDPIGPLGGAHPHPELGGRGRGRGRGRGKAHPNNNFGDMLKPPGWNDSASDFM